MKKIDLNTAPKGALPGMAAACMKNSVSAQSTPTTLVDGSGSTATTPFTPLPETKTGG